MNNKNSSNFNIQNLKISEIRSRMQANRKEAGDIKKKIVVLEEKIRSIIFPFVLSGECPIIDDTTINVFGQYSLGIYNEAIDAFEDVFGLNNTVANIFPNVPSDVLNKFSDFVSYLFGKKEYLLLYNGNNEVTCFIEGNQIIVTPENLNEIDPDLLRKMSKMNNTEFNNLQNSAEISSEDLREHLMKKIIGNSVSQNFLMDILAADEEDFSQLQSSNFPIEPTITMLVHGSLRLNPKLFYYFFSDLETDDKKAIINCMMDEDKEYLIELVIVNKITDTEILTIAMVIAIETQNFESLIKIFSNASECSEEIDILALGTKTRTILEEIKDENWFDNLDKIPDFVKIQMLLGANYETKAVLIHRYGFFSDDLHKYIGDKIVRNIEHGEEVDNKKFNKKNIEINHAILSKVSEEEIASMLLSKRSALFTKICMEALEPERMEEVSRLVFENSKEEAISLRKQIQNFSKELISLRKNLDKLNEKCQVLEFELTNREMGNRKTRTKKYFSKP